MDVDVLLTIILYGSIVGAIILIIYAYQTQQQQHVKKHAEVRRPSIRHSDVSTPPVRYSTVQQAVLSRSNKMPAINTYEPLPQPTTPDIISDDEIDWLSLASDELRIPLSNLRALAKRLHSKQTDDSDQQRVISRRMIAVIDRMEGLLEGWNTSAQMSGIRLAVHPHSIALIQFVEQRLRKIVGSDQYTVIGDQYLQIMVDPDLLGHAIDLIIINSKRIQPRGHIDVVIRILERPHKTLTIAIADRRANPIPLPDMWEKMEYSLSQTIIEDQGGAIFIEPRARGGQIVTIALPGSCIVADGLSRQYSA